MSRWVEGTVVERRHRADNLYSLRVDAPEVRFKAGQFGRVGLPAPADSKEPMIGRPYSFVNSPDDPVHEFYFVALPGGPLSPRLAALDPGDPVFLLPQANGFFTMDEVPSADVLWCLATGTGIGPFLSILRTGDPWSKFRRVVLVHGVRHANELGYREVIDSIAARRGAAFRFVPMVTREAHPGALAGRIPAAIEDRKLEDRAGTRLAAESAHVMLCGNPAMVADAQTVLLARGLRRHRRREPGHITVETYW